MLKKSVANLLRSSSRKLAAMRLTYLIPRADPTSRRLLEVLDRCLHDHFSSDEVLAMDQVEAYRAYLEGSPMSIRLVDFGAGSPSAKRTVAEMEHGVIRHDTVASVCKRASKSAFWGRLLFTLLREYQSGTCLEFGTCLGISASYQASALRLNGKGLLLTLEGAPSLAEIAVQGFEVQGFDETEVRVLTGRFQDTLPTAIDVLGSIDYVFIDGHHDELATLRYFRDIKSSLNFGAILVFDDISWSEGMRRAWKQVERDPDVSLVLDLGMMGVCLIEKAATAPRRSYRLPIY